MTLENRMAKLEKQNRWLKTGGTLGVIFLSSLFLMGTHGSTSSPPAKPSTSSSARRHIRATRFTLTDSAGKTRATLLTFKDKLPGLFMHDDSGRVRITLSMTKNGTVFLSFLDRNKKTRLIMGLSKSGLPQIKFLNSSGNVTKTLR